MSFFVRCTNVKEDLKEAWSYTKKWLVLKHERTIVRVTQFITENYSKTLLQFQEGYDIFT